MLSRITLLLIALLLLGAHAIAVFAGETDSLQLTTSVSNLSYCRNQIYDGEFDVLIKLQLTYTNASQKPIILEREPNLVVAWRAKKNLKELESADYTHILWMFSDDSGVTETGNVPSANFVVLKPGEAYQSEAGLQIPSARYLIEKGVITNGDNYLQVIISKWSGTEKQALFLKDRWKKTGVLWSSSVLSQPMLLTIESQPKIVECPRNE